MPGLDPRMSVGRVLALCGLPLAFLALKALGAGAVLPDALAAIGLLILGLAARAATGSLPAAVLAQSGPFLSVGPLPDGPTILAVSAMSATAYAMVRTNRATDRSAALFGLAAGAAIAGHAALIGLSALPLLLIDRRRLAVAVFAAAPAAALALAALPSWRLAPLPAPIGLGTEPFLTLILMASGAMLAIYFRLRRRALLTADPLARLLAGIVAAQGTLLCLAAWRPDFGLTAPAVVLAGPAAAILYSMMRPLFSTRIHARAFALLAAGIVLNQVLLAAASP